jgi:hypothetical protein
MATDTPTVVELIKENFAQSLAMVWPLPRVCVGFRGGREPAS